MRTTRPRLGILLVALGLLACFGSSLPVGAGEVDEAHGTTPNVDSNGPAITGRFASSVEEILDPSEVAPDHVRSTSGEASSRATAPKVLPIVSPAARTKTPYAGIFSVRLTDNGRPLSGPVNFGVAIVTPDDSFVDSEVVMVENGTVYYVYNLAEDTIGDQIGVTFFVQEDDLYLASSASPRNYELVDRPLPVLSLRTAQLEPTRGALAIGVVVPYLPDVDWLPVEMTVISPLRPGAQEDFGAVQFPVDGRVSYVYDMRMSAGLKLSVMAYIRETNFTRASSSSPRDVTISESRVISYSLPRGSILKRSGTFRINPSGDVTGLSRSSPFFLAIEVDGRTYRFSGTYEGRFGPPPLYFDTAAPYVYFDYLLPDSTIGKTARMTMSHSITKVHAAGSSSPRFYQIVK